MIEERRQNIGKHLEDPDDENAHHHPLPYLLGQRGLYDPAEAEAQHSDDRSHHDCRSNRKAFAESSFVYRNSVN